MSILQKIFPKRPVPLPRKREFERAGPVEWVDVGSAHARTAGRPWAAPTGEAGFAPTLIDCPRCSHRVAVEPQICDNCGFPFVCDITPVDTLRLQRRTTTWRTVLAIGALMFWLTSAGIVASGSDTYTGITSNVALSLQADSSSGIPLSGPSAFVGRTQLALGLLKSRAPEYYYRMQQSVTSIDFLGEALIDEHSGKRITLEGIGALSTPSTGRVQVLLSTAFPSGLSELTDHDVFSYAGVLIHELRHIELHRSGDAPGGWQEEVRCEEAAYAALKQMDAPGALLANYELYLSNPHARRYQDWYDWYKQF